MPTQQELQALGLRTFTVGPSPITAATVGAEGSMAHILNVASSTMGGAVSAYGDTLFAGRFLETAIRGTEEVLDRYAWDLYQGDIVREDAQAAVVQLQIERLTSGQNLLAAGFTVGAEGGIAFRTLVDLPMPEGDLGPWLVDAICVEVGIAGNVDQGTLTNLVSQVPTGEELAVTNPERAVGGTERQTNVEFGESLRRHRDLLEKGTLAAIEAAILAVPGVSTVFLEHVLDGHGIEAGFLRATISSDVGGANSVLVRRVNDALRTVRGGGVPVYVQAGTVVFIPISAEGLLFVAGYDTNAVLADARRRVVAAVNLTAPSSPLLRSTVIGALRDTPGLVVPDGAVTDPIGDVIPSQDSAELPSYSVVKTQPGLVSLNGAFG